MGRAEVLSKRLDFEEARAEEAGWALANLHRIMCDGILSLDWGVRMWRGAELWRKYCWQQYQAAQVDETLTLV